MRRWRDRLTIRITGLFVFTVACVSVTMAVAAFRVSMYNPGKLHHAIVWIGIGGFVLSLGLGLVVALAITRPLRRTASAARRFGAGDLDVRLPTGGRTELADLGDSFNAMAAQLSDTLRDLHESQTLQQRFVADVSHELRTPLAAMIAADEGLESPDQEARRRSVDLVRGQTRRLVRLVDDLLEMSRFDAGQTSIEREHIDLAVLAADAAHTVAPGEDIRIARLGDTSAEVDARRLHTVLRNLLSNALQHGRPPVDVVIDGRDPGAVTLSVADDGAGVPAELAPTVFDRFVRADEARTSQGAHSGLGLSLAYENARLHGGTLSLSTAGRTTFTLQVPRSTPHEAPGDDLQPEGAAPSPDRDPS
ncbi:HAMP domain-containing histidine kinase [Nocardioides anomalus]|uniref:histidine kinase n=1 Tax=Nocardioides anomalus TaxID=2712223 RepID=A0A6G6WBC0_9ACTN|nr:HAMP domain-containing sensor histidine kinase [Nocardioides anomalus]QIG42509.1 HAMP domain-containing histidine kinase [Nocardioides anomalus]